MASAQAVIPVPPSAAPRPWRPFRGGAAPFPVEPTTPLAKEAAQLWQKIEAQLAHIETIEQARRDAHQALELATEAYEVEVNRAGRAGEVSTTDAALLATRERCREATNPTIYNDRARVAAEQLHALEWEYLRYIDDHALELVAELKDRAERVAAKYRKVIEEFNKRLAPIHQEHALLVDAVRFLIGNTCPFEGADIPTDFSEPPYPTAEALARYEALHNPEPPAQEDEAA